MNLVYSDEYFNLTVDDERASLVRSPQPFPSVAEFARVNREVVSALRGSAARRVLLDLRGGPPGRNDEAFEAEGERLRRALAELERVAVLVKTAAGKLQLQRMSRGEAMVFQDEAAARRYLET